MTRDELLEALTVERFGTLVPRYTNEERNYDREIAVARTDAELRRYELDIAVDDQAETVDPWPSADDSDTRSSGATTTPAATAVVPRQTSS